MDRGTKIQKIVPFDIHDRFDPMMPITRRKDDLRFLSLGAQLFLGLDASKEGSAFAMIDFAKENPGVENVNAEHE